MWFPYQRDSGQLIVGGLRSVVGREGILYGFIIGLVLGMMGGAPPLEAQLFPK